MRGIRTDTIFTYQFTHRRGGNAENTATEAMKTRINIKANGKGYGKNWAKVVTGIDETQKGGYMFLGYFVDVDQDIEVEEGSVILHVEFLGSRKNGELTADVHVATPEGLSNNGRYYYKSEFLDLRDRIKELLAEKVSV